MLQVITSINKEKKKLLHDRTRSLDRKILTATNKIGWNSSKGNIDAFCTDALRYLLN